MQAIVVREFGGIEVLELASLPVPEAGPGQALIRVEAAGVGPWDAWVRSGRSVLPQPLPLTPGADIAGKVVAIGEGVDGLDVGDAVFGATNSRFTGGYAEYALADVSKLALLPDGLDLIAAASMPVVASTAWQMLFDVGKLEAGKQVLVIGAAGAVGSYAVQLAHGAGATVTAYVRPAEAAFAAQLGADKVCSTDSEELEALGRTMDLVVDTVGGTALELAMHATRVGGRVVSAVEQPYAELAARLGIEAHFILVDVNTACLSLLGSLAASGSISPLVGDVLPLRDARRAHEMLEGAPRQRGKIVLSI